MLASSCSDWLDYSPKDQYVKKQQFATTDGFYSAVNGVYNRMASDVLYGRNLSYGMIDVMAQRYMPGSDSPTAINYLLSTYNYTDQYISSSIDAIWTQAYSTILNINVVLGALEEQEGVLSEKDYKLIKGDCLALRAFIHFDLLRLFGPRYTGADIDKKVIPFNDSDKAQAYDFLSSKEIIYDHLLPDLDMAENLLKESDPVLTEGVLATDSEDGDNYTRYRQLRLNYYALILLKARIHLWTSDYAKALEESKRLIEDDYVKSVFPFVDSDKLLGSQSPDRVFSTEVLFGFYKSDRASIYADNFDASSLSGVNLLQPRAGYIEQLFPNQADYRFLSQWHASGNMYSFYKFGKISYDEENPPFYVYLMPLMRISEAYYIAAEAALMINPDDLMGGMMNAITYLTPVRVARGLNPPDFFNDMFELATMPYDETIRDLWGEGQIFFMLKRIGQGSLSDLNNANTVNSIPMTAEKYTLPLPASEQENR